MFDRAIGATAGLSRALPPFRGRGRAALVLGRWVRPGPSTWNINMRRGHRMTVPASSAQSWRAAFTASYDDAEIDLLVQHITPGSLVLDIGASLGFYTVPFATAARQVGARVLAIEPVAQNCEVIRRNVDLNGLAEVVSLAQTALGRARGQVTLHVESGGAGNAAIITGLEPGEVRRHDVAGGTRAVDVVQMQRLDDLQLSADDNARPCSLIKLDAEGYEIDILAGAESFIERHRPVILAELIGELLKTRGVGESAPIEWAEANDYLCHQLTYRRRSRVLEAQLVALEVLGPSTPRSGADLVLMPKHSRASKRSQ